MRAALLAVLLAAPAAAQQVPYYLRQVSDMRDVDGINSNDRALSDTLRQVKNDVAVLPTLSGNNSWTGTNAYEAATTFNGDTATNGEAVFNASATFNGLTNLGQVLVASGTFNLGSSMSIGFSALASSGVYRLSVGAVKDGNAGQLLLRFNSDTGANYDTASQALGSDGTANNDSGVDQTNCYVGRNSVNFVANGLGSAEWVMFVNPDDATRIGGPGRVMQQTAANVWYQVGTVCHYDGSAAITSIQLVGGTGSVGGYMNLVRLQ